MFGSNEEKLELARSAFAQLKETRSVKEYTKVFSGLAKKRWDVLWEYYSFDMVRHLDHLKQAELTAEIVVQKLKESEKE